MSDGGQMISGATRRLWEALFSLHVAFAGMSAAFRASTGVMVPFARMEYRINVFLHVRQTDFIRGYLSIWAPSTLAALAIWLFLRLFAHKRFARWFLRVPAGAMTILAPIAFRFIFDENPVWRAGWPFRGAPFEIAAILACAFLFLAGRSKAPAWVGIPLAAHYAYWYLTGTSYPADSDYSGLSGAVVGFCSAMAWTLYVNRARRVRAAEHQRSPSEGVA